MGKWGAFPLSLSMPPFCNRPYLFTGQHSEFSSGPRRRTPQSSLVAHSSIFLLKSRATFVVRPVQRWKENNSKSATWHCHIPKEPLGPRKRNCTMDGIEGRKTPFPSCFRAFSSSSSSSAVRPNPNRLPSSLFARRPLPLSPSLVEWWRERVLIRSLLRPPPPPPPPSPSSVSASPPERGDETTEEGFFSPTA